MGGLKWDYRIYAAPTALNVSFGSCSSASATIGLAFLATLWGMGESTSPKELLLSRRKHEFQPARDAPEVFVGKIHKKILRLEVKLKEGWSRVV